MFPCVGFGYGFWWIFPIIMIIFCFFMMIKGMGSCMMGRRNMQDIDNTQKGENIHLKENRRG